MKTHALALLAVLLPGAQDPAPFEPKSQWTVHYADEELGIVSGTAFVDEKGTGLTIDFEHPETGFRYPVTAAATRDGEKIRLVVSGTHPSAAPGAQPDLSGLPRVVVDPQKDELRYKVRGTEGATGLRRKRMADLDVAVELQPNAQGDLEGGWSYKADALTERDRRGGGRVGTFGLLPERDLIGEQRGREVWTRAKPRILATICVTDQTAANYGEPAYRYPSAEDERRGLPVLRTLLVIGENLKGRDGAPLGLASGDPAHVDYTEVAREYKPLAAPFVTQDYQKGWDLLSLGMSKEELDQLRKYDEILVRARLKRGVRPGAQTFTLKGAPGEWTLVFGDNAATLDFVRHPHEDLWEPTPVVFHKEIVQLQLSAELDLPVDEVELVVGAGGKIVPGRDEARPTFVARRVPPDPASPSKKVFYRTEPILVVDPARPETPPEGALVLAAPAGERLMARLVEPGLFNVMPDPAQAEVRRGPGELGSIWKEYLKRAADCAGLKVEDWSTISGKKAGEISHTVLFDAKISRIGKFEVGTDLKFAPKNETLRVTIADHAAMLLLREDFMDALKRTHAEYAKIQGPVMLEGFGEMLRSGMSDERNPLSRVRITSPNGYEVGPWSIFNLDYVQERFKLSSGEAYAWRRKALQQALDRYRDAMAESLRMAADVGTCDLEGLVHLTGFGFDAVVHRVLPRLMKLEEAGNPPRQRWVPDLPARAAVRNLSILADAVRALEEYSETDTAVAMAVASLVAMPFMAAETALAKGIALGVDLAGAAVTAGFEIPDYLRKRDDVRFSRGASAVLGTGRLDLAELREVPTWQAVLSVAGAAVGVGFSSVDLALTLRNIKQVRRAGEEAVAEIERGGLAALRRMDPEKRKLVLAYAADAGRVRHEAGADALTEAQKKMLSALGRMEEEARVAKAAPPPPLTGAPRPAPGPEPRRPLPHLAEPGAPPLRPSGESPGLTGSVRDAGRTPEPPRPPVRADDPTAPPRPVADDPTAPPRPAIDDPGSPPRPRISDPDAPTRTSTRRPTTEFPDLPPTRSRSTRPREAPRDIDDARPPLSPRAVPEKPPARRDAARFPRRDVEARIPEARKPRFDPAAERTAAPKPRLQPAANDAKVRADAAAAELRRIDAAGGDPKLRAAAKDRSADLKGRKELLDDLVKDADAGRAPALSDDDLDWLSGKRTSLTDVERRAALDAVQKEFKGDWKEVLRALKDGGLPKVEMHKILAARKELVDGMLDDVMKEVAAELSAELGKTVTLERKAFGSTNLTSDYDLSISGPGAERVVGRFNKRFRERFGRESGTFFDTNVYTDPVYDLVKADSTLGSKFNANPLQRDELRQMMYEQMATAKYSSPGQWEKHVERMVGAVDEAERPALRRMLQEVETRQRAAELEISDGLRRAGLPDTPDARLRVNNEIYATTLERIDEFRDLGRRLSEAADGRAGDITLPPWLRNSAFERDLKKLDALHAARNTTAAKRLKADLEARISAQLRNHQGKALYHASEAYQGEGTIGHVVKELQASGRKVDPDVLLRTKPGPSPPEGVREIHYLGSFHENRANMTHQLHDVLDDGGAVRTGVAADRQFKASMKAAKYFVRQLDGAHHGGINLLEALPADLRRVVRETTELDDARKTAEQFAEKLKELKTTPEDYLRRVMAASDKLSAEAMARSPFRKLARELDEHFKEVDDTLNTAGFKNPFDAEDLDLLRTRSATRPPPGDPPPFIPPPTPPPSLPPGTPLLDADRKPVAVGKLIGRGKYAEVYEHAPGKVIKLVQRGDGKLQYGPRTSPRSGELEGLDRTPADVVRDIKENSDLLASRGIRQLEVTEIQTQGQPYMIARARTDSMSTFKADAFRGAGREKLIAEGKWTPEHEAAVVDLYADMAQKRLFWEDGGIENLYFERVDGKLRAGVLDQDRLGDWDKPGVFAEQWRDIMGLMPGKMGMESIRGAVPYAFSGPEEFMAKMLEHKGWIRFDPETRAFKPGLIDPEVVRKKFGIDAWVKPDRRGGWIPLRPGKIRAA